MMKNIPNILTVIRTVLALILLFFFTEMTFLYILLFSVAMFTDIIDGTIARSLGAESYFGAVFDSIADLLLDLNIIKLVITCKVLTKKLGLWMVIALGIGIISPVINFIKHKKFFMIHSVPCKIVAGAVSVIPFAIHFGFIDTYILFCLALLSFAMIEIVIMSILLKKPDPDAKSIYHVIKENKALKA
ncbi:MAG: CDP-alcohol phosphatidyltransferase family protein [Clostridia bacterium]|nr:CDP-alcohol phosphatidyltransferase family protein [Clostridia bacterium]